MMVQKMIKSMTSQCKKGWRYGEDSCFFNSKCILSLLLATNTFTILTLILNKEIVQTFKNRPPINNTILVIAVLVFCFIAISLICPKQRTLQINLKAHDQKRYFVGFIIYGALTFSLLMISAVLNYNNYHL
jgi:hypothetical protein